MWACERLAQVSASGSGGLPETRQPRVDGARERTRAQRSLCWAPRPHSAAWVGPASFSRVLRTTAPAQASSPAAPRGSPAEAATSLCKRRFGGSGRKWPGRKVTRPATWLRGTNIVSLSPRRTVSIESLTSPGRGREEQPLTHPRPEAAAAAAGHPLPPREPGLQGRSLVRKTRVNARRQLESLRDFHRAETSRNKVS